MRAQIVVLLLLAVGTVFSDVTLVEILTTTINTPTAIVTMPGDSSRIFVAEKSGKIYVFPADDSDEIETYLDLEPIQTEGELGLLGIAFHPEFTANSGYLFVLYTPDADLTTVLSRFEVEDDEVDTSSEVKILEIDNQANDKKGGQLVFGEDGFLYIGVGQDDTEGDAQDPSNLKGKILRIDVDIAEGTTTPPFYNVPDDNPDEEIYLLGFQSPRRFSFDSETGLMWIADSRSLSQGEISVFNPEDTITLPSQYNFGWPVMDGCSCVDAGTCDVNDYVQPIHQYTQDDGDNIIGGYVYHGSEVPDLEGLYVFADSESGKIWTMDPAEMEEDCGTDSTLLDVSLVEGITTFGVVGGELYLGVSGTTGKILKFAVPAPPVPDSQTPSTTSTSSITASISRSASASPSLYMTPVPPPVPSVYPDSQPEIVIGDFSIHVEWDQDGPEWIHFKVTTSAAGWVALGISTDGTMDSDGEGSDLAMGYLDSDGVPHVNDYFTDSHSLPQYDDEQNIHNTNVTRDPESGDMTMRFSRRLDSGDFEQDRVIPLGVPFYLIWATSEEVPSSDFSFSQHDHQGSIEVILNPLESSYSASSSLSESSTISASISFSSTPLSESQTAINTRHPSTSVSGGGAVGSRTPLRSQSSDPHRSADAPPPSESHTPRPTSPGATRIPDIDSDTLNTSDRTSMGSFDSFVSSGPSLETGLIGLIVTFAILLVVWN